MHTLLIGQFYTHFRMPQRALVGRVRLERILRSVLDDVLEHALDRVGVPPHEEICIRELRVPLRMRLAEPDRELTLAWSIALAHAIKHAIDGGDTDWVVRYGSQVHALIDFTFGIARGDLRRAWAWLQMGLASEEILRASAPRAWQRTLLCHPEAIVPVLSITARRQLFSSLALQLDTEIWLSLAQAAIAAVGGHPELVLAADYWETSHQIAAVPVDETLSAGLTRSPLARSVAKDASWLQSHPKSRAALAALVCLDVEPGIMRRRADDVRQQLRGAANFLDAMPHHVREAIPTGNSIVRPIPAGASESPTQRIDPPHPDSASPCTPLPNAMEAGRGTGLKLPDNTVLPSDRTDWPLLPIVRSRAFTEYGGLLMLVHVLTYLKFSEQIEGSALDTQRQLRWILHRLALTLVSANEYDPAVLAFAGLSPDAQPPSRDLPTIAAKEQSELSTWAQRIGEALGFSFDSVRSGQVLVDWLCRRRAEVVADPGWIEVHFSIDDSDPTIRRAGLDLDPGFVPWLGVVLKFIYE